MKFTSLLAAIAGAAMVLATPQASRAARGRRGVGGRNSHVRRASGGYSSPSKSVAGPGESDGSDIEYFTNWSGAIAEGNGFNYARGTFVVPVPQTPAGADPTGFYSSAVWVGIDGSLCQSGLIQTGVLLSVQAGVPQYSAWYEWYPALPIMTIDDFPVNAGDTIRMSVYAYNTTAGMTMIENLTQNQVYQQTFSGETNVLCLESAEWIVEDWSESSEVLIPFANFTTVTFTDCYTNEGGVGSAVIGDIVGSDGNVLTSCEDNGVDSVTCTYL